MKILFASLLLIGISFVFIGCDKKTAIATPEIKKEVESYWTCSMHPQIHKDGPGKCPICGMDLVKVSSGGAQEGKNESLPQGHGEVFLTPEKKEMIGLKMGEVVKKTLFKTVETAGRVAFDPELFAAQNEYIEAVKQEESVRNSPVADVLHSARAMVDSSKMRLKILGLSDAQITALRYSSKTNEGLLVPKSGDQLWIYAEVYEIDLPYIRPKLIAKISGQSLGGKTVEGEVVSVDRVINPVTRTAKVRIAAKGVNLGLRPEAYVDVKIEFPLGERTVVPFDAVFDTGKESWIFVVEEKGKILPRKVLIDAYAGDEVAVVEGVTAGDKIVTSANFLIDSESRFVGTRTEEIK